MRLDEYRSLDATGLPELVDKGEVNAIELLERAEPWIQRFPAPA